MDEVQFTEDQQEFLNKLVGDTRVKARETAKKEFEEELVKRQEEVDLQVLETEGKWKELVEKHQSRILELEPLVEQVEKYQKIIEKMVADRLKVLGDVAKVAVKSLPGDLNDLEILHWLNENEGLFVNPERERGTTVSSRSPRKPDSSDPGTSGVTTRL